MDLSVVVIFYNMRREAARTLYSLSREYKKNTNDFKYEVISVDNGSKEPLDETTVKGMGDNFRYFYFDDAHWTVRHVEVDTGGWLIGRLVLISPHAIESFVWAGHRLHVGLTREQV